MAYLTNTELREFIKELDEELAGINTEQVVSDPVSSAEALECYKRHLEVVMPLLIDYAALVLASDEFMPVGKDEQIREWINALEVASNTDDMVLACECTLLANVLLPPLISGDSIVRPAVYADMVAKMAAEC